MSIQELEAAVTKLTPNELAHFAESFAEYHWQTWDRQIERDATAGKLDGLIKQANDKFDASNCKSVALSLKHSTTLNSVRLHTS